MSNTASISLQNLDFNFDFATSYSINIDKNFTREVNGNRAQSTTQTNVLTFTTFSTGSHVINVSPLFGATDIALPIVSFTFDRVIFPNTGNFYLYRVGNPDQLILTIPAIDSRVSASGSTYSINFSNDRDYFVASQTYYITSDVGIAKDIFKFPSAGIVSTDINFTYKTAPSIINVYPSYDQINVNTPNIGLTYDRKMSKNSGNFKLWKKLTTSTQIVDTIIPVSDQRITTATQYSTSTTSTVFINLSTGTVLFSGSTTYYLSADFDVLRDQFKISSEAIINDNVLRFTTGAGPKITTVIPSYNTSGSFINQIGLKFNKNIFKNTGTLYLHNANIGLIDYIPASTSSVSISNTSVSVLLANNNIYDGGSTYYLTADDSAFTDQYFIKFDGIADDSVLKFTQLPSPVVSSVSPPYNTTGTYISSVKLIFNRPMIKNVGNFYLYGSSLGLIQTIPVTGTNVVVINNTCTIDISTYDIKHQGEYFYITADGNILKDTNLIPFRGISDDTVLKFRQKTVEITARSPALTSATTICFTNAENGFNDLTGKNTVTNVGVILDTTRVKFGTKSAYWGNQDSPDVNRYLKYEGSSLNLGNGDFTWDAWIYPESSKYSGTPDYPRTLLDFSNGTRLELSYGGIYNNGLYIVSSTAGTGIPTATLTKFNNNQLVPGFLVGTIIADSWNHIVIMTLAGKTWVGVNGTMVDTGLGPMDLIGPMYIGYNARSPSQPAWSGWMDNIRLSNSAIFSTIRYTTPSENDYYQTIGGNIVFPITGGQSPAYVSNLSLTFNGPIVKNTGTFYLWQETPNQIYQTFDVNSSTVSISSSTLSIPVNLPEGRYYLTMDPGVIKDTNDLVFAGIADIESLKFSQTITPYLTNVTYIGNTENVFFTGSNTPQTIDTSTSTITVNISSTLGQFSANTYGLDSTSTYTFTGTNSQINSTLASLRFFPNKNLTTNGTYRYIQTKNGLTQIDRTYALTASSISSGTTATYIITTNTATWVPPYKFTKYGIVDILVVGGGGGGGSGAFPIGLATGGGGGGAGGFIEQLNQYIPQQYYNITVGTGGTAGVDGSNSSFYNYTATGGKTGTISGQNSQGGNSGYPTFNTAGYQPGGAGAGNIAGNGDYDNKGGSGLASTILNYSIAGGGGYGQSDNSTGSIGRDGGGNGATNGQVALPNATAYGAGGGGGYAYRLNSTPRIGTGGTGGSGVVALRFHPEVDPVTTTKLSLNTLTYPKHNQDRSLNTSSIFASISVLGVYSSNLPDGDITLSDSVTGVISTSTSTTRYWTPQSVSIGSRIISATYQGDGYNLPSTATQILNIVKSSIQVANVTTDSYGSNYLIPVSLILDMASARTTSTITVSEGNTILTTATQNQSTFGPVTFPAINLGIGSHNLIITIPGDDIFETKIINYSLTRDSNIIPTVISGPGIIGYYGGQPYVAQVYASVSNGQSTSGSINVTVNSSNLNYSIPTNLRTGLTVNISSYNATISNISDNRFGNGNVTFTANGFSPLSSPQGYTPILRPITVNFTGNGIFAGGSYTFNVLVMGR